MPSFKQVLAGAACLVASVSAVPTPASTTDVATPTYPWPLPANYPRQNVNILAQGTPAASVPTHFALFGYSYDGSIVNQSFYANGQPYNKDLWGFLSRPGDNGNQTYGSYAFGLGPHSYLYAYNDGRIAVFNDNDGQTMDMVTFESWKDWWDYKNSGEPADKIPTCEVIPSYNVLYCTLNGDPFRFSWCNSTVPYGIGYTADTVAWGTTTDPCTEIVFEAVEVPVGYGDTYPAAACAEYPDVEACQGDGGSNGTSAATNSTGKA